MPNICVVQINVNDMDQAIDFYVDKLGFEIESRQHYPQIVHLKYPHFTLLLYRVANARQVKYPDVAQTMINIETTDLDADLKRLRTSGAEVVHDTPQPCPVGRYAAVRDPAGNVVELLQYEPTSP